MDPDIFRSLVLTLFLSLGPALAGAESDPEIESAARQYVADQALSWMQGQIVLGAVREQNLAHAGLSPADISELDSKWRKEVETGTGSMISSVTGNPLSTYLKTVQTDSRGLITEIFVMDSKGLNVGQSSVTSDFWQSDEDKWLKTFLSGPSALYVDEVELDDSSQRFQVQVSVPVVDPVNGKTIGAVTLGIDAEGLLMM